MKFTRLQACRLVVATEFTFGIFYERICYITNVAYTLIKNVLLALYTCINEEEFSNSFNPYVKKKTVTFEINFLRIAFSWKLVPAKSMESQGHFDPLSLLS